MEVNGELDSLRDAIPAGLDALAVGGRVVFMSYQSLEDRVVKQELAPRAKSKTPEGLPVELPGMGPEFKILTVVRRGPPRPRSKTTHERHRSACGQRNESREGVAHDCADDSRRVGSASLRRSDAAQRAYERRRQRATVAGHPSASDTRVTSVVTTPKDVVARIPFVATIIGLLCLGLAATLLLTTRSAEDSYELAATRAHNQTLREQAVDLKREVEAGNSAPVLAQKAAELGLIPAKDPARLLQASRRVGPGDRHAEARGGKPVAPLDRTPAPTVAPERPRQQTTTAQPTTPPSTTRRVLPPRRSRAMTAASRHRVNN